MTSAARVTVPPPPGSRFTRPLPAARHGDRHGGDTCRTSGDPACGASGLTGDQPTPEAGSITTGLKPGACRHRVADALAQARQARGLTQQQAARAPDWPVPKLTRIEAGTSGLQVTDLRAALELRDGRVLAGRGAAGPRRPLRARAARLLRAGGEPGTRHRDRRTGPGREATHMSPRPPQAEPLLTRAEVATIFRVDPKTVTRWAKAGRITSVRTLGGHRRYRETEVRALLAGTAAGPGRAGAVRPPPDPCPPGSAAEAAEPAASRDSWMAEALRQGAGIDAEAARIPAAQARRRRRGAGARL
jgi:excisionase family DNA binding protein